MELLNSESQQQVQGGIKVDCNPSDSYCVDKPDGCSRRQTNIINCANWEQSNCDGVYLRRLDYSGGGGGHHSGGLWGDHDHDGQLIFSMY